LFTPNTQRIVPGFGNKDASICIIGEAPGMEEDRLLRPFVGPSGTVLDSCLHAAGLTRQDCYITNTIKVRPRNNDITPFYNDRTGCFTLAGGEWITTLRDELSTVRANVLVPLGSVALAALTGKKSVSKYRGYVMESLSMYGKRKVIGAYHPAATLRGQYILRYYISADLRKAKDQAAFPEIRRPKRNIVTPTTFAECLEWLKVILPAHEYACDIEVENFEVSAISFALTPNTAVSFPFHHNYWAEEEEVQLWWWMNQVLTTGAKKIFQNGIFDIAFLVTQCGIKVAPPWDDTMIAHSIMYPEMLKGLGFLGSMYCGAQEYWKDMVKWDNIKEES
jgi:uracil-DNA glycosylase family 4